MGCLVIFFIINISYRIPVLNANSIDTDQTPRPAASDLDLDCLSLSISGTLFINELSNTRVLEIKQNIYACKS